MKNYMDNYCEEKDILVVIRTGLEAHGPGYSEVSNPLMITIDTTMSLNQCYDVIALIRNFPNNNQYMTELVRRGKRCPVCPCIVQVLQMGLRAIPIHVNNTKVVCASKQIIERAKTPTGKCTCSDCQTCWLASLQLLYKIAHNCNLGNSHNKTTDIPRISTMVNTVKQLFS